MTSTEAAILSGVMRPRGLDFSQRSVIGGLRDVTFRFHGGDTIFQGLVGQIGEAALDGGVKPSEAAFGFGQLGFKGAEARRVVFIPG